MLGQKKKEKEDDDDEKMKSGLIQNNYIQLFHFKIFLYKYILLQLKSSQRLKTAPLTEDGCFFFFYSLFKYTENNV